MQQWRREILREGIWTSHSWCRPTNMIGLSNEMLGPSVSAMSIGGILPTTCDGRAYSLPCHASLPHESSQVGPVQFGNLQGRRRSIESASPESYTHVNTIGRRSEQPRSLATRHPGLFICNGFHYSPPRLGEVSRPASFASRNKECHGWP